VNRIYGFAIGSALLAIAAKLTYYFVFAPDEQLDLYVRFFYLLALLLALFFGMREAKLRSQGSSFAEDVKAGMKAVSVFALLLSAFTWVYYKLINPGFFTARIKQTVDMAQENGQSNIDKIRETAEFIFNPFIHTTITLFGLMVLGLFYTLILAVIFRSKAGAPLVKE